jgi:SAM-dependent methyltransferase
MVHTEIQLYVGMNESPNALNVSEDFEFEALSQAENYRNALLWEFSEHLRGNVLEVGAGIGQMTEALLKKSAITKFVSIEPDAGFYGRLLKKFPGHAVIEGTINDLKDNENWDAIVNVNVLEHIGDDTGELKSYHRCLAKKNGVLCLFVPARPEIYAPIDKDFGHFRRYTRPELRQKVEDAGFQILRLRYYNMVGYLAWWFNFCVLKKRRFDAGAVRFFDRFIFPPVHGFESRVCHPFIGQNLLATARAQ